MFALAVHMYFKLKSLPSHPENVILYLLYYDFAYPVAKIDPAKCLFARIDH